MIVYNDCIAASFRSISGRMTPARRPRRIAAKRVQGPRRYIGMGARLVLGGGDLGFMQATARASWLCSCL